MSRPLSYSHVLASFVAEAAHESRPTKSGASVGGVTVMLLLAGLASGPAATEALTSNV